MMKKIMGLVFLATIMMLPVMAFSAKVEIVPLRFEAMGIKIFTTDDKLPPNYESISLFAASGLEFYSVIKNVSSETRKKEANAIIIIDIKKSSGEYFVFGKVIKIKE